MSKQENGGTATAVQPPTEKLNKGTTVAYSLGYGATGIVWYMVNNYLTLFYTDVVGLAASAISLIFLISRIWDAVNDPMMGMIVDRTKTRWGKFRPYIAIAAPFLAIFNVLTFTAWPLEGAKKVVVCLLCYIAVGMCYTIVQVAINGLVNRLTNNSQHKMDMIAMAQVANSVISAILSACAMPLILYFSKSDVATGTGYSRATIVFSIVAIPLFWICAWRCKEVKNDDLATAPDDAVNKPEKKEKTSIIKSLKAVAKNRYMMIVVIVVFLGAMSQVARMSMLSYYLIYVVGAYAFIAPVFTVISVMQIIGNALLPVITRNVDKVRWLLMTMIINGASMVVLFFLSSGGIAFVIFCSALYGFTNSATSICYSMMCDSIEYGEYKFGIREDALAFSFMSFGVKVAQAVTGSVTVLLLAAVGYVAGAEQSLSTQHGINAIVNLLPGIIGFVALIPLAFYKLDQKTMGKVRASLEKRRAGEEDDEVINV